MMVLEAESPVKVPEVRLEMSVESPRRERKRLKTIPAAEAVVSGQDGGGGVPGTAGPVNELVEMKRGKQPEIGPVGPAGGYKTSQYTYALPSPVSLPAPVTASRKDAVLTTWKFRLGPRNSQTLYRPPLF